MRFWFCECPKCGYSSVIATVVPKGSRASAEAPPAWCFSCGMLRERDVKMRVRRANDTDDPSGHDARLGFGVGAGNAQ